MNMSNRKSSSCHVIYDLCCDTPNLEEVVYIGNVTFSVFKYERKCLKTTNKQTNKQTINEQTQNKTNKFHLFHVAD